MTRYFLLSVSLVALLFTGAAHAVNRSAPSRKPIQTFVVEVTPIPAGCGNRQCWCDQWLEGDCEKVNRYCDEELVCDPRGMCSCPSGIVKPIILTQ